MNGENVGMQDVCKAMIVVLMLIFVWPVSAQVASPPVLIKNVNVIAPDGKVQENVSIEITGGKITAIGKDLEENKDYKDYTVLDKQGKFVIPGLIDLRVQLGASPANRMARAEVGEEQRIAWLNSLLKMGVTTARLVQGDLGEQTDLQRWRERALLNGPAILAAGPTFTADEGIPAMEYAAVAIPTRIREVFEVKDPDDAMKKAREVAHTGANVFEIVFSTGPQSAGIPRLSDENLAVLTKEAHGHELKAFCLVGFNEEAQKAIANGCDVLEGMTEELLNDVTLKEMSNKHVAFMPEMVAQGYLLNHYLQPDALRQFVAEPLIQGVLSPLMKQSLEADKGQIVRLRKVLPVPGVKAVEGDEGEKRAEMFQTDLTQQEERAGKNVRKAKAAGVTVVTGTSAGGVLNFPGASEHLELELLVQNGFTPSEALQAATANAAASIGRGDRTGSVAVGKDADLVLLDANPLDGHSKCFEDRFSSALRMGR
jgi:Imidazolonepropionase and related amidohydrolases